MRWYPSSPFATHVVRRRPHHNSPLPPVDEVIDDEPEYVEGVESPNIDDSIDTGTWLSTGEAAERLGVDTAEVRRRAREGDLRATKVDGSWLIDPASIPAPTPSDA